MNHPSQAAAAHNSNGAWLLAQPSSRLGDSDDDGTDGRLQYVPTNNGCNNSVSKYHTTVPRQLADGDGAGPSGPAQLCGSGPARLSGSSQGINCR
jgi:hypothetical protein